MTNPTKPLDIEAEARKLRTHWIGNKLYVDGVLAGTVSKERENDSGGMVPAGWEILYEYGGLCGSGFHGGFGGETEARAYFLYDVITRLENREKKALSNLNEESQRQGLE